MTRYLITGATTPLGVGLVQRLLARSETEVVLALGAESRLGADIDDERLTYVSLDLTRRRRVWRLLFGQARELGVEVLVHSAQHRSASQRGRRVHALNVETTRTLLSMCERHPTLRRFILRSHAEVYAVGAATPDIMDETHPLSFDPGAPQWVRDRVEADLTVCARMGLSPLQICVLRAAECLAPDMGSQLHDYFKSRVCFHPLGYDPMLNLISLPDLVDAFTRAATRGVQGVYNIPGHDTLPLSAAVRRAGRLSIGVPTPLMTPLYAARRRALEGADFSYALNHERFHFNGVLDGSRAEADLGYTPKHRLRTWR